MTEYLGQSQNYKKKNENENENENFFRMGTKNPEDTFRTFIL